MNVAICYSMKRLFCLFAVLAVVGLFSCKRDVESLIVIPQTLTLKVGETYVLQAIVKPDEAQKDVKWSTSEPGVAKVNDAGVVTAVSFGKCDITAAVGTFMEVCHVEVSPISDLLTITVNGVIFNMKRVKHGDFVMGAADNQLVDAWPNERPRHKVTITRDYYIGETEVTQELWQAVMGNNPSNFTGDLQRPVERVSWDNCQEFIEKLNQLTGKQFALPTEAQWEFAARGGNKNLGYKYAGSDSLDEVAWYESNSGNEVHTVKAKKPNELGLYDMSGNVLEWCVDWCEIYDSDSQTDPIGPATGTGRVSRGGGWNYNAKQCRSSRRILASPGFHSDYLGFRLVLLVP